MILRIDRYHIEFYWRHRECEGDHGTCKRNSGIYRLCREHLDRKRADEQEMRAQADLVRMDSLRQFRR